MEQAKDEDADTAMARARAMETELDNNNNNEVEDKEDGQTRLISIGHDRTSIDSLDMMIFDDEEEDVLLPWKEKNKREQELVSKRLDAMNRTAEQLKK